MLNLFLKRRGFTLAEVLLSVTLLSIIGGMTIPMYRMFMTRDDLDIASSNIAWGLRRAQSLSFSSDGDMAWGIRVGVGSILVFKGASYVTRDSSFDEYTALPQTITPSGLNEVVFSKVYGVPSATGTFILTSQDNDIRTIKINEKGMVEY